MTCNNSNTIAALILFPDREGDERAVVTRAVVFPTLSECRRPHVPLREASISVIFKLGGEMADSVENGGVVCHELAERLRVCSRGGLARNWRFTTLLIFAFYL